MVGKIINRMTVLKTMYADSTKSAGDLENYDKEFKELQSELGHISKQKFNGVSLFSDQVPEILFGDSVGLDVLKQSSDVDSSNQALSLTRWGIHRGLSQKLESGDKFPTGFGENPPNDFLTFVLSDEASGGAYHDEPDEFSGMMKTDIDDWKQMIGERNLDGKIALIAVQAGDWGSLSTPDELLPKNGYIPEFASIYENFPRDDSANIPSKQEAVSLGVTVLKNAFLTETNNATELPAALGLFIDDTGSVNFEEVDEASRAFLDWVKAEYPDVTVSSKDGGGWTDGIYSASSERWIKEGRIAVEDLLDNDADVIAKIGGGSLDQDNSGVRSVLDAVYNLDDFDMSELVDFLDKVSDAQAVNAAEQVAVNMSQLKLEKSFTQLEVARGRILDTDIALESSRMAKSNVLVQASSSILVQANQLPNIALTLLSG